MLKSDDRRSLYSKRVIRQALFELMQTKPLNKISVTEICAKADINRSTFYAYYDDIFDLHTKIIKAFFEKQRENHGLVKDYIGGVESPRLMNRKDFYNILFPFFRSAYEDKELFRFIYNQNSTNNIHVSAGKGLYRVVAPYFYSDGDSEDGKQAFAQAFTFAKGGVTAMLIEWLNRDCDSGPEAITRLAAAFAFGVFTSEPGLFRFN